MKRLLLTITFFALYLLGAAAQFPNPDSTRQLQTVEITAAKIRQQSTGGRQEVWEKTDLQNHTSSHLGDVLAMQSGVFVKSYGLGSSATTSVRGGSASHTQVMWNGLPIQNPMLGQLDFSLIPIVFVDEMSVAYGGNTASWGSGAIGGTVFLENEPSENEGLDVNVRSEVGSFGWWDQQLRLGFGKGKWQSSVRLFHQQAENDFTYAVAPNLPVRKQENAALEQNGLLFENYWKPKPDQQFSTQIWLQSTHRQIPPRTVQARSEAEQTDRFVRSSLQWKKIGERGILSIRGGLFREEQGYTDPRAGLDTRNDFWKGTGEATHVWHFSKRQQLEVGFSHLWLQSEAGAYRQARAQNRSAAFALFRQKIGAWEGQINLRQEVVDGGLLPIVPCIGIERALADWLQLSAKASRNYRLPTLNDLYWQPGGNPDLKPEHGWSQEAGFTTRLSKSSKLEKTKLGKKLGATYSATFFNRNINDWIQWAIVDGQPFYSPHNITKVWSRGIEHRIQTGWHFKKMAIELKGGYDFIRSTYQRAVETPRFEKGEQLAYTPEHQWFASIFLQHKNASLSYQHRYTGSVGTLNFSELPSYHLGTFHLDYEITKPAWKGRLFFRLENAWDADYEVIEYRAMPGRYFRAGLEISLNEE